MSSLLLLLRYAVVYVGLNYLTLSEDFARIKPWTFAHCKKLSYIQIPDSMQAIDDYAFAYCSGLDTVFINKKDIVGDYAFVGRKYE